MRNMQVVAALGLLTMSSCVPGGLALQELTVDDCADLSSLADALEADDVTATVANNLSCDVWTTVVVPENRQLTIDAAKPTWRVKFTNVRFEVQGGEDSGEDYNLVFAHNVKFFTTIEADVFEGTQDLDGGVLHVQSGGAVLFEGFMSCIGISIASALIEYERGWKDADHRVNGGCWYNEGRINAMGLATFNNCENSGGGENYPGGGGAVHNHASGYIELAGGIVARNNDCNDDFGGDGGAIYNAGTFVVGTDAEFVSNIGANGGAIFNDEGATFTFETEETLSFYKNRHGSDSDNGGDIQNFGSIMFESYVKFLRGEGVYTSGPMEFKAGGLFKNQVDGALIVSSSADLGDTVDLLTFKSNEAGSGSCEDITYFVDGSVVCGP